MAASDDRAARLAAQLRANLRRRKAGAATPRDGRRDDTGAQVDIANPTAS